MSEFTPSRGPIRRSRWLLGIVAVLVPIVPIVLALVITGAGTAHTATAASQASASTGRSPATAHHRPASPYPPGTGSLVAYVTRPQPIRASPGGRSLGTLGTRTSFGTQMTVLVQRIGRGQWLGVVSPIAGNGRLGWIRRSHVVFTRVAWMLHVSLDHHELVVDHDGRTVRHDVVATGRPTAPTPTGTFAVTDRLTTGNPEGPYGCCILALSAKAPHAISDWDGGNRIAIHSYPITSTIGQSVSHGCIHVTDAEGEWLLKHVPLGTPVVISSA